MSRRLAIPTMLAFVVAAGLTIIPAAADGPAPEGWVRVQLDHRITAADRAGIERAGVAALQYSPPNAYVGYATSVAQTRAASLPHVAAVRPVRAEEKIDPSLGSGSAVRPVTIIGDGFSAGWGSAIAAIGTVTSGYPMPAARRMRAVEARLPLDAARRLATRRDVLYVGPASPGLVTEDEASAQILANNLQGTTPKTGYEPFLASLGLDGTGVTMSIADDGIDLTHPEFSGRIAQRFGYLTSGTGTPADGHGTHVAGIAGGQGVSLPGIGRVKDSSGFLYGIGVAPKMTFVDQKVLELVGGGPSNANNLRTWIRDGAGAGAYGWNASWHSGEGTGAGYIANAALLDGLTRDANEALPGNQPFTLIFSAGNAGSAPSTITSPKEAKNIITVANSLSHRAGNINSIATGSSRGPAKDGRILPTVAAPGSSIVSARSATGSTCNTSPPTDSFGLYSSCSGTSMAAPHVTGSVALIVQWWRKTFETDPSTAMTKALLINSATDMGTPNIPNGNEGWGRVNLASLFAPTPRIFVDQSVLFTTLGQAHSVDVTPADPTKPMKVSLVWTDAPGEPGADLALVNDLDLTVTSAGGAIYRGNWFSEGTSVAGGARDELNNLENVFVANPGSSSYRIDVSAFNLPGDGVPGTGTTTDQDFALVISNALAA